MRRREFIAALGVALWPTTPRAQQAMPVIGFLSAASPVPFSHFVAAFRQGLKEVGYIEGKNLVIEYRWAEGQYSRLPRFAVELVQMPVAVLVATGGDPAVQSGLVAAGKSTPVVFATGGDPVKLGYVASLNRPGGNVTGATHLTIALAAKRLALLIELAPKTDTIAVLNNPNFPNAARGLKDTQEAAISLGIRLIVANATKEEEFEAAFGRFVAGGSGALMVAADPFFNSRRTQLVELAAQHRLPAIYEFSEFPMEGGLMSYGTRLADTYRDIGVYSGRILSGANPGDLPVVQSTRFDLVINLNVALAQGIEFPPFLLARADQVIE
jgi:putative ABC transport system substrate-binding protein